jgi:hypothetical protein
MRTIKSFLYLFLFFSFIFQSCSIEKRRYTNGYNLQWKKNNQSVKTDNSDEILAQKKQQPKMEDLVAAFEESALALKNINLTASNDNKKGIIVFTLDSAGCDTLVMRNETEIKAKVIEITPTEIKYKYCDNVTGPTYVSYRYEVSYIKYANGRLDSFKDEFAPIKSVQDNNQVNYSYNARDNGRDNSNWIEEKVKKRSVVSTVFGFISLVPFFGIPAIFIGLSNGLKALRLIKKNERELGIYKQRAFIGIALTVFALLVYILLWVYLLWKAGLLPKI